MWNAARDGKRATAGEELCVLSDDDDDYEPLPAPTRARALLSIGVRSAIVRARRGVR